MFLLKNVIEIEIEINIFVKWILVLISYICTFENVIKQSHETNVKKPIGL